MDNSIASVHPELIVEWSDKNLPISTDTVSFGSNKQYWWVGPCGHEWQASPKSRSSGEGCPICSGARVVEGINDLKTLRPDVACEWSDKNELLPTAVSVASHKKVLWNCKLGHEWTASIKSRTVNNTGCPYCSHNAVLEGFNDLQTIFPKVAKEWSKRNYPLKPNMVTAYRNEKVWWKCKHGHEWNALISTRSYGSKCPVCSGITLLKGFNDFATTHPNLASEWSEKNYPLMPDMVNAKSTKNVWWKCKDCGNEWKSVVKARVKGTCCPVCADRAVLSGYNDLETTDRYLLAEWDYEKNGDLLPSMVSRTSMRFVWWKCPCGHRTRDKISNRTIEAKGCRECEKEFRSVLPQMLIQYYTRKNNLEVELHSDSLIGIDLFSYIPEANLCIEPVFNPEQENQTVLSLKKYLCKKRKIAFECIYCSKAVDDSTLASDIKKAFSKAHIYIYSDDDDDIELMRQLYYKLKYPK